jgi:transposase
MSARTRRTFDREFKINAINLHKTSGRSVRQLSQELSVPESTYGKWVQAGKADGSDTFPGKGRLRPSDAENARLRRALAIACEERDILKKAVGIFSSQRGKNTNL